MKVLTSLSAYKRKMTAFRKALKSEHGLDVPEPGQASLSATANLIWFGRGEYLLTGAMAAQALSTSAAIVDQSDAWACVELSGPEAHEVLALLSPVDMRPAVFAEGSTVRTLVQHMNGSVTRLGSDRFLIMVFRSMASTLAHDLKSALESVAARG